MPIKIMIPTALREYVGNRESVESHSKTIGDALRELVTSNDRLKPHLFNEQGRLRNFVNVYLNDEDIRSLERDLTPLKDGDVVTIVPAIAGGTVAIQSKPPTKAGSLSLKEIRRYGRHLIMPEVGLQGQAKLKAASVLLVGAGGLGSPTALYLAAAGVGRIGMVDFDSVDSSNLQRQVMYGEGDVGKAKIDVAKQRLLDNNPYIEIETHKTQLTSENALNIISDYDVVVDGTDNFPTRYLVNDACVLLGKPNVYGSIFRFEGQASVFDARRGPCYRCLYPEPPPPGLVPSCAEGGVLGILPGIIGTIQATETVKLIIGQGDPLIGRLLLFDALRMQFKQLRLRKDPNCPICGPNPTVTKLIDYEQFCGIIRREESEAVLDFEIGPEELKSKIDRGERVVLLDVREPHEYEICRLEGAKLIPLGQLPERVNQLSLTDEIVAYCHVGSRSGRAVEFMRGLGFGRVRNLQGGIDAWAERIDPSLPRY
jgi:adenylyltransferase/sulfurtransferase